MPQVDGNGFKTETAMANPSARTGVLPITALATLLPSWSALEDPLDYYRKHIKNIQEEYVDNIELAASYLSSTDPHLVAFPTETVYGLGADATRSACVQRIYWAKNRPADNPLIVHVASLKQLSDLTGKPLPEIYQPLAKKFWPGPLTIILPLPDPSPFAPEVTHNLKTFGVRMPATPLARLLIALSNRPIAAPSANTSKRPSTTTAQHVLEDLNGRVDIILDGGPCGVGVESTVVDGTCHPPAILRPGGVGIEDIRLLGGQWQSVTVGYNDVKKHEDTNGVAPRAPGMKYKHYAPKGAVHLFKAGTSEEQVLGELAQILKENDSTLSMTIAVIRTSPSGHKWFACQKILPNQADCHAEVARVSSIFPTTTRGQLVVGDSKVCVYNMMLGPSVEGVAREVFAALRACDELSCDLILIEGLTEGTGAEANGLATAVMNRLRKATMG